MQLRTDSWSWNLEPTLVPCCSTRVKYFRRFSPYSRDIGDLLVEEGLITEAELLGTLKLQKMNSSSPLGELFLMTGKLTIAVIEMMVHEQIRQSVNKYQSWKDFNVTFVNKDILPYDRINLQTREFISPETLRSAAIFFPMEIPKQPVSPAATTSLH